MDNQKLLSAVRVSAKIISTLMAAFVIFMFAGDVAYSIRHPGTTHIRPLSTTAGRRDAVMMGMMALIVVSMLLVWWKEKAGAWLSIISVTAIICCVWYLNGIPIYKLACFLLAAIPATVLLVVPRQRRLQATSL